PRPAVTLRRKGTTSSGASGPPNDMRIRASMGAVVFTLLILQTVELRGPMSAQCVISTHGSAPLPAEGSAPPTVPDLGPGPPAWPSSHIRPSRPGPARDFATRAQICPTRRAERDTMPLRRDKGAYGMRELILNGVNAD